MKMVDHQWNLFLSFTFWIAFALEMLSHLIAYRVKVPTKHIFMSTIINVGIPLSGQDRECNSIRICFGAEGCTLRFFYLGPCIQHRGFRLFQVYMMAKKSLYMHTKRLEVMA